MKEMKVEINKRIIFLDYLRVFAFVSVLVGHKFYQEVSTYANSFETPHITQQYLVNIILSMFKGGGAGVTVFFMISGYIILHVLQSEKPIEFMIKRVFRIYPLLIFAIFVQVIIYAVFKDTSINLLQTIQQMSLFGDFFNTPHALGGIEWTLRVEILFYILMFLLSFSFLIKRKNYSLLFIFSVISIGLYYVAPFPSMGWTKAYLTMSFPFLFIGSALYMYENKTINLYALSGFIILVFYLYFNLTEQYQPNSLQSNFVVVGFLVFIGLWLMRNKNFIINSFIDALIIKISLLTYSVYLFHNFLWSPIGIFLHKYHFDSKFWILLILLLWCYLMYMLIETPMNKLGKRMSKYVHQKIVSL